LPLTNPDKSEVSAAASVSGQPAYPEAAVGNVRVGGQAAASLDRPNAHAMPPGPHLRVESWRPGLLHDQQWCGLVRPLRPLPDATASAAPTPSSSTGPSQAS